jgi:hypothetical protein
VCWRGIVDATVAWVDVARVNVLLIVIVCEDTGCETVVAVVAGVVYGGGRLEIEVV